MDASVGWTGASSRMQATIYITCLMQVSFHIQVAWEENKSPQIYYIITVFFFFVKKKEKYSMLPLNEIYT